MRKYYPEGLKRSPCFQNNTSRLFILLLLLLWSPLHVFKLRKHLVVNLATNLLAPLPRQGHLLDVDADLGEDVDNVAEVDAERWQSVLVVKQASILRRFKIFDSLASYADIGSRGGHGGQRWWCNDGCERKSVRMEILLVMFGLSGIFCHTFVVVSLSLHHIVLVLLSKCDLRYLAVLGLSLFHINITRNSNSGYTYALEGRHDLELLAQYLRVLEDARLVHVVVLDALRMTSTTSWASCRYWRRARKKRPRSPGFVEEKLHLPLAF